MKECKKCGVVFARKSRDGFNRFNERKFCSRACVYASGLRKEHGFTSGNKTHPFYKVFHHMKERCNNPKSNMFSYYGKRGIKCLWTSFEEFKNDMYESYLEHVEEFGKKETTIDRIDNDGNYCKENCRWATYFEQANNKRNNIRLTFNGIIKTQSEWARHLGIPYKILKARLEGKWSVEKALNTPFK